MGNTPLARHPDLCENGDNTLSAKLALSFLHHDVWKNKTKNKAVELDLTFLHSK